MKKSYLKLRKLYVLFQVLMEKNSINFVIQRIQNRLKVYFASKMVVKMPLNTLNSKYCMFFKWAKIRKLNYKPF